MILMRDGQIAENGSHAQLMAKARDYAALFTSMQQEVRFRSCRRCRPGFEQGQAAQ